MIFGSLLVNPNFPRITDITHITGFSIYLAGLEKRRDKKHGITGNVGYVGNVVNGL